jgi:hypothetical protein
MTTDTRARKRGSRWQGQFRFGGYWFALKRHGRLVTFHSAKAARTAAAEAVPAIASH